MGWWHPYCRNPLLHAGHTTDRHMHSTEVVVEKKVQCQTKKRKPLLRPSPHCGCWSVLEAKIEIPDTPVVNIAHASLTLGQALL